LLPVPEQRLLHRLSVFAGSFSLEAAQAVATDAAFSPQEVVDGLGVLLEKSLLVAVAADAGPRSRLRLFDSIRSFAAQQLDAAGATLATQTRHMHWMREVLERAAQRWHDTPALIWLAQLRPELDNLRVALRHALQQQDAECALALFNHGVPLWQRAGLRHEAVRWLDAVRPLHPSQPADARSAALRAGSAQARGQLYVYGLHGLPAEAEAALQQAVQEHHELGDTLNEYFDLYLLNNT
jgi:predicted ATPase